MFFVFVKTHPLLFYGAFWHKNRITLNHTQFLNMRHKTHDLQSSSQPWMGLHVFACQYFVTKRQPFTEPKCLNVSEAARLKQPLYIHLLWLKSRTRQLYMIKSLFDFVGSCLTDCLPHSYSVFLLLCGNLSQTSISTFISRFGVLCTISRSDIASSLMPFMCWIVGGGGKEAQSLLGFQLSGPSESDLLRQLWHLHGAPALAPTRCQGTVSAAHKCLRKKEEEHKHMLRGTTHGSAALFSTLEHTWLQVEGGEKEKATKDATTTIQILLTCTLLCSMVS